MSRERDPWEWTCGDETLLRLLRPGETFCARRESADRIEMHEARVATVSKTTLRCDRASTYRYRSGLRYGDDGWRALPWTDQRLAAFRDFEARYQALAYIQAFDFKRVSEWQTRDLLSLAQALMRIDEKYRHRP